MKRGQLYECIPIIILANTFYHLVWLWHWSNALTNSISFFLIPFFFGKFFKSNLYTHHGTQTHNPKIKSCILQSTEPARRPSNFFQFINPGLPPTAFWFLIKPMSPHQWHPPRHGLPAPFPFLPYPTPFSVQHG